MTRRLNLVDMGDSFAVIFPDDVLTRLNARVGDTIYVTPTADGVLVTMHDPESPDTLDR